MALPPPRSAAIKIRAPGASPSLTAGVPGGIKEFVPAAGVKEFVPAAAGGVVDKRKGGAWMWWERGEEAELIVW